MSTEPLNHVRVSLYPQILGAAWATLAPGVRLLHAEGRPVRAAGTFRVRHGRSRLLRWLAHMARLPRPASAVPVQLTISPRGEGEIWSRSFGGRALVSWQQSGHGGLLAERLSLLELYFGLEAAGGALHYRPCGAAVCLGSLRLRLPAFLAPRVRAREWEARDGAGTRVRIAVSVPWLGPLIVYGGTLTRQKE